MSREQIALRVSDVMTRAVATCTADGSLRDAASVMWTHDCGSVPVVADRESKKLVGIITDRDVALAAALRDRPLRELRVGDVMSSRLITCRPDDRVSRAEALMSQRQLRRLPVVDEGGRLLGILTLAKIARRAVGGGRESATGGHREHLLQELGETLAAISHPSRRGSSD